jgi:hypothetical protein
MLLTFKSKGAADVLMYEAHAKPLLDLLHKDARRGVITAAEAAGAVARLEQEIALSKAREETPEIDDDAYDDDKADAAHELRTHVSFGTRAYPLLEMLRAAQRGGHHVMWGV